MITEMAVTVLCVLLFVCATITFMVTCGVFYVHLTIVTRSDLTTPFTEACNHPQDFNLGGRIIAISSLVYIAIYSGTAVFVKEINQSWVIALLLVQLFVLANVSYAALNDKPFKVSFEQESTLFYYLFHKSSRTLPFYLVALLSIVPLVWVMITTLVNLLSNIK